MYRMYSSESLLHMSSPPYVTFPSFSTPLLARRRPHLPSLIAPRAITHSTHTFSTLWDHPSSSRGSPYCSNPRRSLCLIVPHSAATCLPLAWPLPLSSFFHVEPCSHARDVASSPCDAPARERSESVIIVSCSFVPHRDLAILY